MTEPRISTLPPLTDRLRAEADRLGGESRDLLREAADAIEHLSELYVSRIEDD